MANIDKLRSNSCSTAFCSADKGMPLCLVRYMTMILYQDISQWMLFLGRATKDNFQFAWSLAAMTIIDKRKSNSCSVAIVMQTKECLTVLSDSYMTIILYQDISQWMLFLWLQQGDNVQFAQSWAAILAIIAKHTQWLFCHADKEMPDCFVTCEHYSRTLTGISSPKVASPLCQTLVYAV